MHPYLKETLRIAGPLVIVLVGVVAFASLSRRSPPKPADDPGDPRPLVTTRSVQAHTGTLQIVTDGLVTPYREVTVSAQVGGRIETKEEACNEGEFVHANKLLVQIDPLQYRLEVSRLAAELEQAKVTLEELQVDAKKSEELAKIAKSDLELEEAQRDRVLQLHRNGGLSQSEVDSAERRVLAARNAYLQQNSQVQMQKKSLVRLQHAIDATVARRDVAQMNLDRTTVKAPVSGVIIQDDVEANSFVQPGAPLFTIEDTSAVEVRCNLRLEELHWIWRQEVAAEEEKDSAETTVEPMIDSSTESGPLLASNTPEATQSVDPRLGFRYRLPKTAVKVRFELAGMTYQWEGHLTRYDGLGFDEKTRTIPCRVKVDDPLAVTLLNNEKQSPLVGQPPALMRGMYVTVIIESQPQARLVTVPDSALRPANAVEGEELKSVVWRVRDGKLDRVPAKPIRHLGDRILIDADAAGLTVGDQLVTSQLLGAKPGLKVRAESSDATEQDASGEEETEEQRAEAEQEQNEDA